MCLPADFGRHFLVLVDTEEEFDWSHPFRRDSVSTRAIDALPVAHARLNGFGVTPTYLADFPIVADERSAAVLRALSQEKTAVIGAQLHPWVNPPFDETLSRANSFAGNLPAKIEQAKLRALTAKIETMIGTRPVVYRAGRYGAGANTARLLMAEGYRLDVSIRSLFEYRDEGGPDFSAFPVAPWWVDQEKRLLELPLSAAYVGRCAGAGGWLYPASARLPLLRGLLARTNILQRVALTPEGMPLPDALLAIRTMLDAGVALFSLSFHSPSIVPGHTPYVRDEADLRAFWSWWDGVLDCFARAGVTPMSSLELIAVSEKLR